MAKYLVTGGCGFIGSHLVEELVSQGHHVKILDNLSSGKKENISSPYELIIGDICDQKAVKEALKDVEGCFHLAAIASTTRSIVDWTEVHRVNSLGTVTLLDEIVKRERVPLVYASSAAVYGNPLHVPIKENDPLEPLSPYGLDKLNGEKHLLLASRLYDFPVTCFRLFNVYGPRQNPDSAYSGVISIFAAKIKEGKTLPIFGNGSQVRDFIYVADVVHFLIQAMEQHKLGGATFNLCTGVGTSINTLVQILERGKHVKSEKEYSKGRAGDIQESVGDCTLLSSAFHAKPTTPLEEGLKHLRDWMNKEQVEYNVRERLGV